MKPMGNTVQTMIDEIRTVIASYGHLPEAEVYQALLDEAYSWKMRLQVLEKDD